MTTTAGPTLNVTSQVALDFGISRGLGGHFALTLAEAGADRVYTGRTLTSLHDIVKRLEGLGREALPLKAPAR